MREGNFGSDYYHESGGADEETQRLENPPTPFQDYP